MSGHDLEQTAVSGLPHYSSDIRVLLQGCDRRDKVRCEDAERVRHITTTNILLPCDAFIIIITFFATFAAASEPLAGCSLVSSCDPLGRKGEGVCMDAPRS